MKNLLFFYFLLLPIFISQTSCQQDGYAIKGTIANAPNMQVVLEQTFFQGPPSGQQQTTADAKGNFKISLNEPLKAGMYRLSVGAKRMFIVLDGKEKGVEIKADFNNMERLGNASVTGSPTASCYFDRVKEMFSLSDAQQLTPQTFKPIVDKSCSALMKAVMSLQLISIPGGLEYAQDFKQYGMALDAEMPQSKYATDYQGILRQVEQARQQQQAMMSGETSSGPISIGKPAPDISYPDPNGNIRSLSSLKGKVVLLDFWASWCGPCRRENPNVVAIYNKYKSRGFDVFSVSLDRDGNSWKNAIAQDGLTWENHVSDLQHWQSAPAKLYGVSSIPRTFLIGRDGKIVAINPRHNLEQELLKHL